MRMNDVCAEPRLVFSRQQSAPKFRQCLARPWPDFTLASNILSYSSLLYESGMLKLIFQQRRGSFYKTNAQYFRCFRRRSSKNNNNHPTLAAFFTPLPFYHNLSSDMEEDPNNTGALAPPDGVVPNFVNAPSVHYIHIAVAIAAVTTSTIAITARTYTRAKVMKRFGLDDCK